MVNEENIEEGTAPFMIKAMPVATRKLAVACAARAGVTMGPWMDRAVHTQARLEAGENVFPPDDPRPVARPAGAQPSPTFTELRELMQAAAAAAEASGQRMSKRAASRFYGLVDDKVRAAGGLAPRAKRQPTLRIGSS